MILLIFSILVLVSVIYVEINVFRLRHDGVDLEIIIICSLMLAGCMIAFYWRISNG